MKKIISFCGLIFGSYLGWWFGEKMGLMTAAILSSLGAGLGLYFARRLAKNLL
jgi:hypothetical protein